MIVDAHHHFWDPGRADYPWLTDEHAAIRRAFGPADLAPLLSAAGVDGSIVVQTRSSLAETEELLATAAATPFIRGVVGWVDLRAPEVADTIARLRAGPGGRRLVGIRHQVQDEPDAAWLLRDDVRRGIAAVGQAGLAYDLLIRPREMEAALDTVRALPEVRFVIDHLAKPPIKDGRVEPWAGRIRPFGQAPNVWAKVSGLMTEADWDHWTPADLAPFVEVALETFGSGRLMAGSDWPVCLLAGSYGDVLDATAKLVAQLDPNERAAVFGGTAVTVYGLAVEGR